MKHLPHIEMPTSSHQVVNLGLMAEQLVGDMTNAGPTDARNRALLERALAVAAAAEQKLAEQNKRIAFLESL